MRPFSKDDWSYALQELKKPRCLTFGALVCALSIALGSFYLVVGSNLRILSDLYRQITGLCRLWPHRRCHRRLPLGYDRLPSVPQRSLFPRISAQ